MSAENSDGVELLPEPDAHPAAATFKAALKTDSVAFTSFEVPDVAASYTDSRAKGCHVHPVAHHNGPGSHGRVRRHLRQPHRVDRRPARQVTELGTRVLATVPVPDPAIAIALTA
ncbi:hypothetical protein [Subtercola lobariae]|uniref:hypothetical protein n=1 Tax=Subtercola lobariae TaxID=1588641 RepID=UPI0027DBE289|nr:hypothetical protein [Subtercola lobariae]